MLLHLFLIHRYKAASIHYLTPTQDNLRQSEEEGAQLEAIARQGDCRACGARRSPRPTTSSPGSTAR